MAPAARPAAATLNATITLENTELTRPEVAAAVAAELAAKLRVGAVPDSAERYLVIRVSGAEATVEFHTSEGASVGRSVALPEDHARALETIALLATNLVQNEAEELLEELARKAEAARSSAELAAAQAAASGESPPVPTRDASEQTPAAAPKPPPKPAAPARKPSKDGTAAPKGLPPLLDTDFNASLWHPVALYPDSHLRRIHLELGLGYSRVGSLQGIAVTLGATEVDRGFRGIVATGVGSWANGDSEGIAASGLVAAGTGSFRGVQASGLLAVQLGPETRSFWDSWAGGAYFEGLQWGGLVNYVGGTMRGFQAPATVSITTGPLRGVQLSAVNLIGERLEGLQAGAVNLDWFKKADGRSSSRGVQAGAVNAASSGLEGAQFGVANVVVGVLDGAQLGAVNVVDTSSQAAQLGVVNFAADQTGAQLGLVNIAQTHTGFQLGLVNISKKSTGAFLGIASFADNIDTSLMAYASTFTPFNLGIKSAAPWYFTRAAFGYHPAMPAEGENTPAERASFAVGSHIVVGTYWFLDPAIEYSYLGPANDPNGNPRNFTGPELSLGFKPSRYFSAFVGGAVRMEGNDSWNPAAEGLAGVELL